MGAFLTKVVEHVLEHEEQSDLGNDCLPRGQRDLVGRHANGLGHGVEQPNLHVRLVEAGYCCNAGHEPLAAQW